MSQRLNNPTTSTSHRNYGATGSSALSSQQGHLMPDVTFSAFSPTELMSLSDNIGRNIHAVDSNCKKLERIMKDINKSRAHYSTRIETVHIVNTKTNSLNEAITKDLQSLETVVQHVDKSEKKQQELQLQKLKTTFQTTIREYSLVQAALFKEMQAHMQAAANSEYEDGQSVERIGSQQSQQPGLSGEELRMQREIRRAEGMQQLESDILALNSMMQVVSGLVQGQGEKIGIIEVTVENANNALQSAGEELVKAERSSRSYRRKILILLAIAVIVGLIVTGIIVAKINK